MTVTVQSTGLSLFTPSVSVYDANLNLVGSATFQLPKTPEDGATLSVNVGGVAPGAAYYVVVQGADTSAFSTGTYALTLNLGTGPNPTVPLPNTQRPNGSPLQSGGGVPMATDGIDRDGAPGFPDLFVPARSLTPAVPSSVAAGAAVVNGLLAPTTPALLGPTGTPAVALVSPPATQTGIPGFRATTTAALPIETPRFGSPTETGDVPAQRGEEGVPPAKGEERKPRTEPGAQPAVPGDRDEVFTPSAASNESFDDAGAPRAAPPSSALPGADEVTGDESPPATFDAVSLLFAGTWLRWHTAHQRDEERRHTARDVRVSD
jgi:hypothetical protein